MQRRGCIPKLKNKLNRNRWKINMDKTKKA